MKDGYYYIESRAFTGRGGVFLYYKPRWTTGGRAIEIGGPYTQQEAKQKLYELNERGERTI